MTRTTPRLRIVLSAWLLCACALGCVTAPPVRIETSCGVVCAPTAAEASMVAELLETYYPQIQSLLPGCDNTAVEVWLQEELRATWFMTPDKSVSAISIEFMGRILLQQGSQKLPEDLVHELVHALLGSGWASLPPLLEEGLADRVVAHLLPQDTLQLRASRLYHAIAALGGLEGQVELAKPMPGNVHRITFRGRPSAGQSVDPSDVFRTRVPEIRPHDTSDRKVFLYGLGYLAAGLLIDELDYAGLFELCASTSTQSHQDYVSASFQSAVGLEAESELWIAAALAEIDEEALEYILTSNAERFAPALAGACGSVSVSMDLDAFLLEYAPVLSLTPEGPRVALAELPAMREQLAAHWGARAVEVLSSVGGDSAEHTPAQGD